MKSGWKYTAGLPCALLATMVLLAGVANADQTNNWWTGEAGNGLWSSAGNWSSNRVPAATDTVRLGYAGTGEVANVAQSIDLDVDATVYMIYLDCEGDRAVTLDSSSGGHTININKEGSASAGVIIMPATADTNATIDNVTLHYNAGGGRYFLMSQSSGHLIEFGPNAQLTKGSESFESSGAGGWRFQNAIPFTWRSRSRTTTYLDGANIPNCNFDNGMDLRVESDSNIGNFLAGNGAGPISTIQRVGAGDRTLVTGFTTSTAGNQPTFDNSTNYCEVLENTNDVGHLTIRTDWWRLLTFHLLTDADTTVELYNGGNREMDFLHEPGVQGPGDVVMNMDNPSQAFIVYGSGFGHTGDTILNTGRLFMTSYTVTTSTTVYVRGLVETGTYYSSLSPYSDITIGTNATLELNGIDQTTGAIGGEGAVLLGGATLTAQGVAPGSSVGTLPMTGAGALVLDAGATSTFEINATNDYDQVVLPDANLTLGGTLNVQVTGPFSNDLYTDYVIFSLTNGVAVGAFTEIQDNINGYATCAIVGNDVILTLNEPQGTAITIH